MTTTDTTTTYEVERDVATIDAYARLCLRRRPSDAVRGRAYDAGHRLARWLGEPTPASVPDLKVLAAMAVGRLS